MTGPFLRLLLALTLVCASLPILTSGPAAALDPNWWNASYTHRLSINVYANDAITSGYSLDNVFNHAAMVSQGAAMASGDDVRVVRWDGTTFTELDRVLAWGSSWNNAATDIVFKTQTAVSANTNDTSYWLYYGNGAAVSPPANANNVYTLWDDFSSGSVDASKWGVDTYPGITVAPNAGALQIAGTTDATSAVQTVGLASNIGLGSGYRFDSSFAIVAQSANASGWKASFGTGTSGIAAYGGTAFDKQLAFNSGGSFKMLADSSLDGQTFGYRRVTQTFDTTILRHYEDGVFKAVRSPASRSSQTLFQYSANTGGATFDVRYDDIIVRKYVPNEPKATLPGFSDVAFNTVVAPIFAFTVAGRASACNGVTPTVPAGANSVGLGRVTAGTPAIGAQDLAVSSNSGGGFSVGIRSSGPLTAGGNSIANVSGTNSLPAAFDSGAAFGYTVSGLARFSNAWAGVDGTSRPVASGVVPTSSSSCVAYRVQVSSTTPAASYTTTVIYIASPTF